MMNTPTETTSSTTDATVGAQAALVAPKKAASTKGASHKKAEPKAASAAAPAKAKKIGKSKAAAAPAKKATQVAKKAAKATPPREFSKKAIVLDLLKRKNGATLAEIIAATDWQKHTVRGFISGTLGKRMGLTVESTKNSAGERCYRIAK